MILCPSDPISVAIDFPNPRDDPVTKTTFGSSANMFNDEDEDDDETPNVDRSVDLCGTNASTDEDDNDPMAKTAATATEKILLRENIMVFISSVS